jgi:hypothetical protein
MMVGDGRDEFFPSPHQTTKIPTAVYQLHQVQDFRFLRSILSPAVRTVVVGNNSARDV